MNYGSERENKVCTLVEIDSADFVVFYFCKNFHCLGSQFRVSHLRRECFYEAAMSGIVPPPTNWLNLQLF